ncbi:YbjQ family protein [Burkholderia sp. Bp8998]|uniref:YbjQ family protein n=1 Tax=Burkholderia sp. Bp8998 TaxID=2184557 RepID=UPI000F5A23A6|nr:YbjQ family protein [Burkholderia sp. Bp8998]RQS16663.1 YbjQ family protein [Burkholderia sp. Bp8998]
MTEFSRPISDLTPERVTTAFDLAGHTTVRSLGVAQGIIVRSRSIVGSFGAALQTLFGGNITLYTSLCEKARQQAFDKMLADARKLGANAIVAMHYDSTEIGSGITEVICYGTAVQVTRDAAA